MIGFSQFGNNAAASGTIVVNVTVNKGDTVVVLILANNITGALTVSNVTDSGGSSYAQRTSVANTNSAQAFLWSSGPSAAKASTTVSVQMSGTYTETSVVVLTYTGVGALGAVSTNTATLNSPTITATVSAASSWAVGGLGSAANVTYTSNTGNLRAQEASGLLAAIAGVDNTGGATSDVLTVNAGVSNIFAAVALELQEATVDTWWEPVVQRPLGRARYPVVSGTVLVGGGPEAVHMDCLHPQDVQPQRNWAFRAAAMAVALAAASGIAPIDPNLLTKKEAPHVEIFRQPEYPDADIRMRDGKWKGYHAALVSSGMASIDANLLMQQETVRIDKFKPDYPDIITVLPKRSVALLDQRVIDPNLLTQKESTSEDRWDQTYPDWNARKYPEAAYIASGLTFVPNFITPETILLDKWWQPDSQPTYIQHRTPELASPFLVPNAVAENITVDKWFEPASQPTYLPKRSAALLGQIVTDARLLTQAELTSVDKWGPYYPHWLARVSPAPALISSGSVGPVTTIFSGEVVTLDKWWQPASQLTRLASRDAVLYQFLIDPNLLTQAEAVTLDRFRADYPDYLNRISQLPMLSSAGEFFVAPLGERITIDKWLADYPNQLARIYVQPASGSPLPIPEFISLDKWYVEHPGPVRIPPRIPGIVLIDPNLLKQPEQVLLSKFEPRYPVWIWRTPNYSVWVCSGAVFQYPFPSAVVYASVTAVASVVPCVLSSASVLHQIKGVASVL